MDERGNVSGVVVAKLSLGWHPRDAGATQSFLESVPEVAAKLKEARTKDRKFEDVVKSVAQATVLVLVY